MITMLRIDDRLIHGQIAVLWTKQLSVTHIIVANDKVAANEIQKASLKMAAPANLKCNIMPVQDAIDVVNDPRAKDLKILVIVNNTEDAKTIALKANDLQLFNVGNYGLISEDVSGKKKLGDTFYVNEEDEENLKAILQTGVKSIYQLVPTKPEKPISELIK
ncbi:PTS system mannose/fructose/N-acetylgalactosamine-transporter subunit IIB [Lacrimispora sp. JR3]|uniref:PTS system mannose/fructose/N-acetylgalactosamine-transporter subunit IIB n=1 Tax=Lacrimispora sinapis TaxID=3111456 RepID=UPI0037485FD8